MSSSWQLPKFRLRLWSAASRWIGQPATDLGAQALNVSEDFVDSRLIQDAHSRGLKIYVYTVNHPDDISLLRDAGIDGVLRDYPYRVLALR